MRGAWFRINGENPKANFGCHLASAANTLLVLRIVMFVPLTAMPSFVSIVRSDPL